MATKNALIIWREEDGRLRLADADVSWQSLAARAGSTLLVPLSFDEVLDVTAEDAAERVRTLAQPLIGKTVSWKHGRGRRTGVVVGIYDNTEEAAIRFANGAGCALPFDRLTVEKG